MKKRVKLSIACSLIIITLFLAYHNKEDNNSYYKVKEIAHGLKIVVASEKKAYKANEPFIVDVYVTNLRPLLYRYDLPIHCITHSSDMNLLYDVIEEIQAYYSVETIAFNHGYYLSENGVMNCTEMPKPYFFLPGQILHEQIKFTPLDGKVYPHDTLEIEGNFHNYELNIKVPFDVTILPAKEGGGDEK